MKINLYNYLNKPYSVVVVMLVAPLFGFIDRNFVFFFGLGAAFLILRGSKFDWARFGIGQKISGKTVLKSLIISLILFFVFYFILDPVLEIWLGEYDLSFIDEIRGNFVGYIVFMAIMWVFAAFGEEFLFRGYYMKAFAELLGNSDKAWLLAAIFTSLYFGISHGYQGVIGAVSAFLWSFCIALVFNKNRTNLLLLVLVHGIYDSIGITLIYLNKDTVISEWVQQLL